MVMNGVFIWGSWRMISGNHLDPHCIKTLLLLAYHWTLSHESFIFLSKGLVLLEVFQGGRSAKKERGPEREIASRRQLVGNN